MDFAASLKNIEILKNFIRSYNCKHIHFDFYTSTDFKAQIFNDIDDDFIEATMQRCRKQNKPYARILIEKDGNEILYYYDNYFLYEFDLITDKIIRFRSLSHKEYKSGNIKLQLLDLVRQLKNSG